MTFDDALRLTEVLMGFAFILQSIEHLRSFNNERILFSLRIILSVLLIFDFYSSWVIALLFLLALVILHRFQGPYNGGADRMGLLVLVCLCLAYFAPTLYWQEIAFGYLALQLVLSYLISGWVKIVNPDWRSGRALRDVFQFSTYPVSDSLRDFADSPRLLFVMSWSVMLFELLFPLSLFFTESLVVALVIATCFHFTNACIFGLNRFFWIWIAAYPSILWLQQRVFTSA